MVVYFYFFQYIERRRSDMIKLVAAVAHDQVVSRRSNPPTFGIIIEGRFQGKSFQIVNETFAWTPGDLVNFIFIYRDPFSE